MRVRAGRMVWWLRRGRCWRRGGGCGESFFACGPVGAGRAVPRAPKSADSPCQYEHAAARVEYGIAARSVAEINRGLTLARSCGADGLVTQAREVLETGRGLR